MITEQTPHTSPQFQTSRLPIWTTFWSQCSSLILQVVRTEITNSARRFLRYDLLSKTCANMNLICFWNWLDFSYNGDHHHQNLYWFLSMISPKSDMVKRYDMMIGLVINMHIEWIFDHLLDYLISKIPRFIHMRGFIIWKPHTIEIWIFPFVISWQSHM